MHEKARIQIHNAAKLIVYIMHYSKLEKWKGKGVEGTLSGKYGIEINSSCC